MDNENSLHEALRRALTAGDFDKARVLGEQLGQAIIRRASAAEPSARNAIAREGSARIKEHLSLARVMRAHLSSQLQNNTAAFLYQADSSAHDHSWRFSA
jgi:hypothetical protein